MKKILVTCLIVLSSIAIAQSEKKAGDSLSAGFDVNQSLVEKIKGADGAPMKVSWVLVVESASKSRWLFVNPTTYDTKDLCTKAAMTFLASGSSGSSLSRKWECGPILPQ